MKAIFWAFICSLMITTGQVLWKIAIDKNGGLVKTGVPVLQSIINLCLNPYMILGILIYGFATVLWIYLLGKYEFSYIYPMLALVYIISFIYAVFLFKENINIHRWFGVLLITIGVIFINKR